MPIPVVSTAGGPTGHQLDGIPARWTGGEVAKFDCAITSLRVQDGDSLTLPAPGVTAVVGGNNVGKSTLLRQLRDWAGQWPAVETVLQPRLLTDLQMRTSALPDLVAWLAEHAWLGPTQETGGQFAVTRRPAKPLTLQSLEQLWGGPQPDRLGPLSMFLMHYADVEGRLHWVAPVPRREDLTQPPGHPVHQLEDDPGKLDRLSALAAEAFGEALTLDPLSGQLILRVGTPQVVAPPVDRITSEYRSAVGAQPRLADQGDGMRSMLGLLLPLLGATYPIVLVDEPEAFLHPPQAHILGRALGDLARDQGLQVVLATHDRNILTGLLDAKDVDLSVLRLTRRGDRTQVRQLPSEELRQVWTTAALRYSNVLDGLFHQLVILAENERDCRFYAAALAAAHEEARLPVPPHDVLFLPTGGKTGMASLARLLGSTGVPVVATPDLDVLNNETVLRGLVEALGANWGTVQADYSVATSEFRRPRRRRTCAEVQDVVDGVLQHDARALYDGEVKRRVTNALAVDSEWKRLKDYGEQALRASPVVGNRLLDSLDCARVVAVRVGELERFAPTLEVSKGEGWLTEALAAGAHRTPAAAAHVRRLVTAGGWPA